VVFYTGTRTWERLEPLSAIIERGDLFASVLPRLDPLFINLPALALDVLSQQGGYFGAVLQLVHERQLDAQEFQVLLHHIIEQLEGLSQQDRNRWKELLSFVSALVFHERKANEYRALRESIKAVVREKSRQKEVVDMPTMAQVVREEARKEGLEEGRKEGRKEGYIETLQNTLLRLLQKRFTKVPSSVEKTLRATQDVEQLNAWIDRILTASTLKEVGITAKS
jgi:hypothetical protein